MENLPFLEEKKDGWYFRTFSKDLNESDLKWHWDEEDRIMLSEHETDWMFQYDNELPIKIEINKEYRIPKGIYHRLIKGNDDLLVKIFKFSSQVMNYIPFTNNDMIGDISKNLKYHIDNDMTITNSIFRIGSNAWCDLINEVRELYFEGIIDLDDNDKAIIFTDAGKMDIFENELVPLDAPFPIDEYEYMVFVKENGSVKKVKFK